MGKVFFSVGMSLDGFIAPEGMDMAHADDPGYTDWMSQWMELQKWVFQQRFFRENLQLGEGGETGQDNRIMEETFNRTGVSIMGKRMFEGGERFWPEEAPFHTPVFVLTKQVRSPWEDIRIAGGANAILQYLNAGLVDEFDIALAPVFFGEGVRLFDGIDRRRVSCDIALAIHSPLVTHLRYVVKRQ
jgi:dihydrofolate reductase